LRLRLNASRLCFWLLFLRLYFVGRLAFLRFRNGSRDLRGLRGSKPRGAFLRFGLPIGAAETLGGGEIPPAGIGGIPDGFQIARQFERDHRITSFGK
jgi:hypothetical protein